MAEKDMAGKGAPFDDDIMTLFMGIEPDEPGQHGRTEAPGPDKDAIATLIEIRDLCEKFLQFVQKETGKSGDELVNGPTGPEDDNEPRKQEGLEGKEEEDEGPVEKRR